MMNNEYTHVSAHQHAKHGTWMITTMTMMTMKTMMTMMTTMTMIVRQLKRDLHTK